MDQREIQEKLARYQILDSRVKALINRRDLLLTKMLEIETTLNSVEEVKKSKGQEIFLPLGSNVHVPGTLKKINKMIVELGANIAIETTSEKTKDILEGRKKELENGLKVVENEMMVLNNELMRLRPEIQTLLEKARSQTTEPEAG
jgi:prefoldin alpha subunit